MKVGKSQHIILESSSSLAGDAIASQRTLKGIFVHQSTLVRLCPTRWLNLRIHWFSDCHKGQSKIDQRWSKGPMDLL